MRRSLAARNYSPSLNVRDAVSAIMLLFLAMLTSRREDACRVCWQTARSRSSFAARIEVLLWPLKAQATAEVLSQNMPMCLNFNGISVCSRTSHPRTNPASSKSLMVKSVGC